MAFLVVSLIKSLGGRAAWSENLVVTGCLFAPLLLLHDLDAIFVDVIFKFDEEVEAELFPVLPLLELLPNMEAIGPELQPVQLHLPREGERL